MGLHGCRKHAYFWKLIDKDVKVTNFREKKIQTFDRCQLPHSLNLHRDFQNKTF